MKKIKLNFRKFALVDAEDHQELSKEKWWAQYAPSVKGYYAYRFQTINGKPKKIYMHRQILQAPKGLDVDHINHKTLDNRRQNIRLATRSQNMENSKIRSTNTSGIKGVDFMPRLKKWRARFRGKHLGVFKTKKEAQKTLTQKQHGNQTT